VDPALRHPTLIRQNLFWALIYDVVMIPLAAIGWLHALLAEVAMAVSSTSVVANANLLRRTRVREAPAILSEAEMRPHEES